MTAFLAKLLKDNWPALTMLAVITALSIALKVEYSIIKEKNEKITSLEVSLQVSQMSNVQLGGALQKQAEAMDALKLESEKRSTAAAQALKDAKAAVTAAQKKLLALYQITGSGDDCRDAREILRAYRDRQ